MDTLPCLLPFESPKNWFDKWVRGQGRCVQGNNTCHTHRGYLAHAFDFQLKPGTKVLAARPGVVAAVCDRFRVGGLKASLLPRANFVALRHSDGTYTRYVHLMHGGVLVQLGQAVKAGQPIALSGNTGFSAGPHLHFDAVNVLPQETAELQLLYPTITNLPSVAAIFSGPLGIDGGVTAPLVYLSPTGLQCYSPGGNLGPLGEAYGSPAQHRGNYAGQPPVAAAGYPHFPRLSSHPEVIVLVDRGGSDGEQTFVEAAAMAVASVAAALLVPAALAVGDGIGGVETSRWCRCVGVIIANDRPGHEVFSMAPPKTDDVDGGGASTSSRRAPCPVVMVSKESGQVLKDTLLTNAVSRVGCRGGGDCCGVRGDAPWEGYQGQKWQWGAWGGGWGGELSYYYGMEDPSAHLNAMLGGGNLIADGGIVRLGASENCRALVDAGRYGRSSSSGPVELTSTSALVYTTDDDNNTIASDSSLDEAVYYYGSQPQPACSERVGSAGAKATKGDEETRVDSARWDRGRMLYGAQTLPVKFKISYPTTKC